ncbi:universal stress protein [Euzebya tangerina]|uniref:universal stress protein n=1 Tax=Euzebya tangerina TaxID=591198 RepID=UPI000E323709|nr:universal stress protein [Euzebya tangerina]
MKILVGYVDTPEGHAAVAAATAEAKLRDATLFLVHSFHGEGRDEDQIAGYEEQLEAISSDLATEGVSSEVHALVRGADPGKDLVAYAREQDIDLIVIGVRRRSPVGKFVLGSNAQDVLLGADCPVLAVKASAGA